MDYEGPLCDIFPSDPGDAPDANCHSLAAPDLNQKESTT